MELAPLFVQMRVFRFKSGTISVIDLSAANTVWIWEGWVIGILISGSNNLKLLAAVRQTRLPTKTRWNAPSRPRKAMSRSMSAWVSIPVTAKDAKTGLSGSGTLTLTVYSAPAPTPPPAQTVSRIAGKIKVTISGVPSGMTFSVDSNNAYINYAWNSPVTGTHRLKVTALDSYGYSATATALMTITAH